ncbi:MAG: MotA/TolQ/ExbB proton channel family protein [Chlamydiia bacterium]|nr:MotA/TolQ/ExbB proton channel family protein [Chlamydiia bacterium]
MNIDLLQVFLAAPWIYALLAFLSMSAVMIALYVFLTARPSKMVPKNTQGAISRFLKKQDYEKALALCEENPSLFSKMIEAGITSRPLGNQGILDAMKAAGKRGSTPFWQKIALLNDIVVIAPMLGLLGTVTGMFYAFYDLNRSLESLSTLFDGLGISVGTTVAGLIVAILAMLFYTFLKFRLIKTVTHVENEALDLAGALFHDSR